MSFEGTRPRTQWGVLDDDFDLFSPEAILEREEPLHPELRAIVEKKNAAYAVRSADRAASAEKEKLTRAEIKKEKEIDYMRNVQTGKPQDRPGQLPAWQQRREDKRSRERIILARLEQREKAEQLQHQRAAIVGLPAKVEWNPKFVGTVVDDDGTEHNIFEEDMSTEVDNSNKDRKPLKRTDRASIRRASKISFSNLTSVRHDEDDESGFVFAEESKDPDSVKKTPDNKVMLASISKMRNRVRSENVQKILNRQIATTRLANAGASSLSRKLESLRAEVRKDYAAGKKFLKIHANTAAWLLVSTNFVNVASRKLVKRVVEKATVSKLNYREHGNVSVKPSLIGFHSALALSVGGRQIVTHEDFHRFASSIRNPTTRGELFQIFKKWYVLSSRYLQGDKQIEMILRQLNKQFQEKGAAGTNAGRKDHLGIFKPKATFQAGPMDDFSVFVAVAMARLNSDIDQSAYSRAAIASVISFLTFVQAPSVSMLGLQVVQVLNSFNSQYLQDLVTSWWRQMSLAQASWFEADGPQVGWRDFFVTNVSEIFNTTLGRAAWDVFSMLSVASLVATFGLGMDLWAIKRFREKVDVLVGRKDQDTFFSRLMDFVKTAVGVVRECVSTGTWAPLWKKDFVSDWLFASDVLMNDASIRLDPARPYTERDFQEKLRQGKYPPCIVAQMSMGHRADMMNNLLKESKAILSRLDSFPEPNLLKAVTTTVDRLKNAVRECESLEKAGEYRVQPMGVFIYGAAGAGKSDMCDVLARAFAFRQGLSQDSSTRYSVQRNGNFWDGASGAQHTCFCDDLDAVPGIVGYSDVAYPEMIMNIINKKPYQLEQAAVDSKGKVFCNFLLVLYSSNFQNGRLKGRCTTPLAFWRRFPITVGVEVKQPYATAQGKLNMDALDGSNDYWNFVVGIYDDKQFQVTNPFDTLPYSYKKINSIVEFTKFYNESCDVHLRRERERLLAVVRQGPHCPVCCLPSGAHPIPFPCPEVQSKKMISFTFVTALAWFGYGPLLLLLGAGYLFGPDFVQQCDPDGTIRAQVIYELRLTYIESQMRPSRLLARIADKALRPSNLAKLEEQWEAGISVTLRNRLALGALATVITACYALKKVATFQGYTTGYEPADPNVMGSKTGLFKRVPITREPMGELPPPTTSMDDLSKAMQSRLLWVTNLTTKNGCNAINIGGNVVLIPKHVLMLQVVETGSISDMRELSVPTIDVVLSKGSWSSTLRIQQGENCVFVPGREYVLVSVLALPPKNSKSSFMKHVPPTSFAKLGVCFDDVALITLRESKGIFTPTIIKCPSAKAESNAYGVNLLRVATTETEVGDCGGIYIGRYGNYVSVLAYHVQSVGTLISKDFCLGEEITVSDLEPCLRALNDVIPFGLLPECAITSFECNIYRDGSEREITLLPLPELSSLNVAVSRGFCAGQVLGTISPPFPLSTLKSSVCKTTMHDVLIPKVKELKGTEEYWTAPRFKGRMILDGDTPVWHDPYVRQLLVNDPVQSPLWWWEEAVQDYLLGIDNLPGRDSVRPLSDYEAWYGVEDTDFDSVNLKTSAGPPFCRPKREFILFDHEKKTVHVDARIEQHIVEIMDIINSGRIFVPTCFHTLKDEPISIVKNEACKVRVFNTMSCALNFLISKYFAPLVAFMKAFPWFFENLLGLDISSMSCDELVAHLFKYSKDRLGDGDYADYDNTTPMESRVAEATVWREVSIIVGYNPADQTIVFLLALSCSITIRFIKNDLVLVVGINPSGSRITINSNNVINSLVFRVTYFESARRQGFATPLSTKYGSTAKSDNLVMVPPFRTMVGAAFMGDDNIYSVSPFCTWFGHFQLEQITSRLGMVYTAADKSRAVDVKWKTIFQVTILKRTFWFDSQLNRWKAPLLLESIVKMLSFCVKSSSLSTIDHMAVLLSNARRELYYHGRETFNSWIPLLEEAADVAKCRESSLYLPLDYTVLEESFIKGEFPWAEEPTMSSLLAKKRA